MSDNVSSTINIIVVLGPPFSGKSALLNTLAGQDAFKVLICIFKFKIFINYQTYKY